MSYLFFQICICCRLLLGDLLFYFISNSCNPYTQLGAINSKATQKTGIEHEYSPSNTDLKESRLIQAAMNKNHPNVISKLIPCLGPYAINRWYTTCQYLKEKKNNRYTLLHWASAHGCLKIVKELFKHQALNVECLNLADNFKATPLHMAVKNGYSNGQTILPFKKNNDYQQIIEILLGHPGIDVNKNDGEVGSPLHYAVLYGDQPLIDIFLNSPKTDLYAVNKKQSTLIHLLVSRNDPKLLKFVFKHHSDKISFYKQLIAKDLDGHTPLDLAVIQFIKAMEPKSKKSIAFKSSSGTLLKYLLKWSCSSTINPSLFKNGDALLHKIIETANLELFDHLSSALKPYLNQQLNLRNSEGLTPLGFAIKKYGQKNLDPIITQPQLERIINILLDNSTIQVTSNDTTNGNNDLHLVVLLHSKNGLSDYQNIFLEQVAKQLVSVSLDLVHGLNNRKETPLHLAVKEGNLAMVKILSDCFHCANVTIKDREGNNAFHLMVNNLPTSLPIVELFLQEIKDESMNTNKDYAREAFFYAKNQQNQTPFKLLLQKIGTCFSENPKDAKVDQYMRYMYELEKCYNGSNQVIDKLKDKIIEHIQSNEGAKLKEEACVICLEKLYPIENGNTKHILKIYCNHHFHAWCLVQLCHYNNGPHHCPLCRAAI